MERSQDGSAPLTMEAAAAALAYEAYIGRWSRLVAIEFVGWLDVPPQASWCDVGCGTGALTSAILVGANPGHIDALDLNAARVAFARRTNGDPRTSFGVGDAAQLSASDDTYDALVSGLAFPSIRDTAGALREFVRVTKPGGTVAAYVWDFDGEMQLLRYFWKAAQIIAPDAEQADDERFALCQPYRLEAAWRAAGFTRVQVRAIDGHALFCDFSDLWTPFLHGDSPAQTLVQSLDTDTRATLQAGLRAMLPVAADGSISLITRAWAVRGNTPIKTIEG